MNNYCILHGACGDPFGNWGPWLKTRLEQRGRKVIIPPFPTPEGQCYANWEKILEAYVSVGLINQDTIFIGHSLGNIFLCHFILKHKLKIKGMICIAGFNSLLGMELDAINQSFLIDNTQLEKVTDYVGFRYCFYSDDDKYVPLEQLEKFATTIQAQKRFIKGAGHINAEVGYTEFLPILEVIEEIEEQ